MEWCLKRLPLRQVYLVGDPVQLPATVMSTRAVKHGYQRSLFQRLQMAGYPVQVTCNPYHCSTAVIRSALRKFNATSDRQRV